MSSHHDDETAAIPKPQVVLAETPIGADLTPVDYSKLALPLLKAHVKSEIEDAVRWGNTDTRALVERFVDPDDARLTRNFVAQCVEETFTEMAQALLSQHPGQAVMGLLYQMETNLDELNGALKHAHKPADIASLSNAIIKAHDRKLKVLRDFGVLDRDKVLKDFTEVSAQGRLIEKEAELKQLERDAANMDVHDANWVLPEEA